jgi:hypothetical protein
MLSAKCYDGQVPELDPVSDPDVLQKKSHPDLQH